jgi:hypothetical protein
MCCKTRTRYLTVAASTAIAVSLYRGPATNARIACALLAILQLSLDDSVKDACGRCAFAICQLLIMTSDFINSYIILFQLHSCAYILFRHKCNVDATVADFRSSEARSINQQPRGALPSRRLGPQQPGCPSTTLCLRQKSAIIMRFCSGKTTAVVINFLSCRRCTSRMSASTTRLALNGKRSSLKPHLNKLVYSHDNFDVTVESKNSTRSGDEPELRDDASGASTGHTGADGLCKQMFKSVLPNCFWQITAIFIVLCCTIVFFKYWFRQRPVALHY